MNEDVLRSQKLWEAELEKIKVIRGEHVPPKTHKRKKGSQKAEKLNKITSVNNNANTPVNAPNLEVKTIKNTPTPGALTGAGMSARDHLSNLRNPEYKKIAKEIEDNRSLGDIIANERELRAENDLDLKRKTAKQKKINDTIDNLTKNTQNTTAGRLYQEAMARKYAKQEAIKTEEVRKASRAQDSSIMASNRRKQSSGQLVPVSQTPQNTHSLAIESGKKKAQTGKGKWGATVLGVGTLIGITGMVMSGGQKSNAQLYNPNQPQYYS